MLPQPRPHTLWAFFCSSGLRPAKASWTCWAVASWSADPPEPMAAKGRRDDCFVLWEPKYWVQPNYALPFLVQELHKLSQSFFALWGPFWIWGQSQLVAKKPILETSTEYAREFGRWLKTSCLMKRTTSWLCLRRVDEAGAWAFLRAGWPRVPLTFINELIPGAPCCHHRCA